MDDIQITLSKFKRYALLIVFLVGCILCFFPFKDDVKTISLSIGCSLIATAIATYVMQPTDDALLKEHTKAVLTELGIDVTTQQRENRARSFTSFTAADQFESVLDKELEAIKVNKPHQVGQHGVEQLDYYIDLIGASCNPDTAIRFARLLSTFWRKNSSDPSIVSRPEFDFVVTPKGGSPILGYEFAKLCNKPFVLHENKDRIHGDPDNARTRLNFYGTLPPNGTAIIVDDSTTGGTMVMEAAKDLKRYGFNVYTCLVVFAPQVKHSKEVLQQANPPLQLVALKKTHLPKNEESTGSK